MRGIINLFQKKGGNFRPRPGVEVEVEWNDPQSGETRVIYGSVHEVQKKKLVLQATVPISSRLGPGSKVRLCSLEAPWFYSYTANVHSSSGQLLEVSQPHGDLENHQVPSFSDEEKLEYATSVDYRASRSPYNQAAEVIAVGRRGLTLQTNVSIPTQTSLELNLKLPNRSQPLPAQVKAVSSQTVGDRKKFATEVEYVTIQEPELEALWDVALRHHLRVNTRPD